MRLSPERTRRPTAFERLTVRQLSWETVVRLNRHLELFGGLATAVWVLFLGAVILGIDWKQVVEETGNSGKPVAGALVLVIILPTLLFVAARSLVGFGRWRLQRELWRREVERFRDRGSDLGASAAP